MESNVIKTKEELLTIYRNSAVKFRGLFIHHFTNLEAVLTMMGPNENLSINNKIEILKSKIQEYEKETGKKFPNLIEELKQFKSARDILAHCALENDIKALRKFIDERAFTFSKILPNKTIELQTFTIKRIQTINKDMGNSTISLAEVSRWMIQKSISQLKPNTSI